MFKFGETKFGSYLSHKAPFFKTTPVYGGVMCERVKRSDQIRSYIAFSDWQRRPANVPEIPAQNVDNLR